MDNERPIEKLLRAFAKKRRDDAGAPIELHPATRRMLQGEVSRQFQKTAGGLTFWQRWTRLRPRLVYALCALAVVVAGTSLLLPSLKQPGSKPQESLAAAGRDMDLAKNEPAPAATAPASPPVPEIRTRSLMMPPQAKTPQGQIAISGSARSPESLNAQKVEQPAQSLAFNDGRKTGSEPATTGAISKKMDEIQLASDRPATLNDGKEGSRTADTIGVTGDAGGFGTGSPAQQSGQLAGADTLTYGGLAEQARQDVASRRGLPRQELAGSAAPMFKGGSNMATYLSTAKPGVAKTSARPSAGVQDSFPVQRFVRSDVPGSKAGPAEVINTALPTPVLASFQIEQTGNVVRITDNDGSIYTGSIDLAVPAIEAASGARAKSLSLSIAEGGAYARQPAAAPVAASVSAPQNYNFRVSGTNLTLNQPVVFQWNYIQMTGGTAGLLKTVTPKDALTQDKSTYDLKQNAPRVGISGQVQIGEGKATAVEAMPTAP